MQPTRTLLLLVSLLSLASCFDKVEISSSAIGGCDGNPDYILDLETNAVFGPSISVWLSNEAGERVVEDVVESFRPSPAFFNFRNACTDVYTFQSGLLTTRFVSPDDDRAIDVQELHQVPSGLSLTTAIPRPNALATASGIFFITSQVLTINNCPPIEDLRVSNLAEGLMGYDTEYNTSDSTLRLLPRTEGTNGFIPQSPFISLRTTDGRWYGWLVADNTTNFSGFSDLTPLESRSLSVNNEEGHLRISFYSPASDQLIELGSSAAPDIALPVPVDGRQIIVTWQEKTDADAFPRRTVQRSFTELPSSLDVSSQLTVANIRLDYPTLSWEASGADVLVAIGQRNSTVVNGAPTMTRYVYAPANATEESSIQLGSFSHGLASANDSYTQLFEETSEDFVYAFLHYPKLTQGYRQYLSRVRGFSASQDKELLFDFDQFELLAD